MQPDPIAERIATTECPCKSSEPCHSDCPCVKPWMSRPCLQCVIREQAGRIAELEKALGFYADPDTWEDHGYENGLHWVAQHAIYEDGGKVARTALEKSK